MKDNPKAVILIHGFNVTNFERTVGKLRPYFERLGYHVEILNYGYVPFTWQVTRRNPKIAKKLADKVMKLKSKGFSVDVAAHSNGCTIANYAAKHFGMTVDAFSGINPALEAGMHPCSGAKYSQIWYNDGDLPVLMSKWLRWLTPWARKARPWGEMGRVGYTGDAGNVLSLNCGKSFNVKISGHSAFFKNPESAFFLPTLASYCAKAQQIGESNAKRRRENI